MAQLYVEIDLKRGEPEGVTRKVVKRTFALSRLELKRNIQRNVPVDNGKLQGGWFISPYPGLGGSVHSNAHYTSYVNDGTGIYGPLGKPIRPKTAKALKFTTKSGKTVFAKSVRGIKPRRFVEKSITQTERRNDEFLIRAVMENEGLL